MFELYVIAPVNDDLSVITEFDIYDERFFISEDEANQVIQEDFMPYARKDYAVYAVNMNIKGVFEEKDSASDLADTITEAVEKSWEEEFLDRHKDTPSELASDYYFHFNDQDDLGEFFFITPVEYYDKMGKLMVGEGNVPESIIPAGFSEMTDGWFEYDGDAQRGKLALSTLGFVEKDMAPE